MRMFWKTVAANLVASFITFLVVVMLGVVGGIFIIALIAGSHRPEPSMHNGSVLVFDMDVSISDAPPHAMASELFGGRNSRISLHDVVGAIDAAAADKKIAALYLSGSLETDGYASGYAALREVRQAIARFRAKGKKVYAYLLEPTLKDYYLASAANEIWLNPYGYLTLSGLATDSLFLGDALKKYGVGVQVTKVGKYKSATEIFTGNHMSDADREQLTQLLDSIWGELLGDLSKSRSIDVPHLRTLSNEPGLYMAKDALENKLVDHIAYLDQIIDELKEKDGVAVDDKNNTFEQITLVNYAKRVGSRLEHANNRLFSGTRIAVVYCEGEIVDGAGGNGEVGGDQVAYDLRTLRNDDDVKAIVLRVNSPGGSALASEIVQREVRLLREDKKPVIVSFGTLAASGGYWIAAYGDYIFAEPTTITGSIGVFGLKFNVEDIAKEHGLTFDGIKTAKFADMDTMTRPWSVDEVHLAQTLVDYLYDQFLLKVSEGRKLPVASVAEIAQGRVWSGADALKLHLVDAIGGLGDAIALAEDRAHLKGKSWSLDEYPEKRTPGQALIDAISGNEEPAPVARVTMPFASAGRDPVSASLRQLDAQWRLLHTFNDPRGVYARLPYLLQF